MLHVYHNCYNSIMLHLVAIATATLGSMPYPGRHNGVSLRVGLSDGCSTLENGKDANATLTKISLMCRDAGMGIAHCGLQVETSKGTYALAYNSETMAGPIDTPGCVWCQSDGFPMHNTKANGGSPGGHWLVSGTSAGHPDSTSEFKSTPTLAAFMKEVKKFADGRPYYNIGACEDHDHNQANCQLTATELWKTMTGNRAYPCPECDKSCF